MNDNVLWGIGLIIVGIGSIAFTRKYPAKGKDIWQLDFKGYMGGIGCIVIGLLFLLKSFSHK